jgi:hypothetical protein
VFKNDPLFGRPKHCFCDQFNTIKPEHLKNLKQAAITQKKVDSVTSSAYEKTKDAKHAELISSLENKQASVQLKVIEKQILIEKNRAQKEY